MKLNNLEAMENLIECLKGLFGRRATDHMPLANEIEQMRPARRQGREKSQEMARCFENNLNTNGLKEALE